VFLARYDARAEAPADVRPRNPAALESAAKAIVAAVGKLSGSWLEGPGAALRADVDRPMYAGERLGLPAQGRGSVAGFGRRLAALFIDWFCCLFTAAALTGRSAFDGHHPVNPGWPVLMLLVEYVVLISTVGSTIGMRLVGIGIRKVDGGRLPLRWVVVRSLLLPLGVIYDRDRRGLHDKAAGAVAVRL
jgi:hypothetical protein